MADKTNEKANQNGVVSTHDAEVSTPETGKGQGGGRRYSQAYKRRILAEVDRCEHGEVGALLRREGLYYSTVRKWRQQRDAGRLDGSAKKRQAQARAETAEVKRLQRENVRLKKQLAQAEAIIAVQKKVARLLETFDD